MYALIVESPAKSKTIGKYLGGDYKILSSFGHVRALPAKKGSVDTNDNFNMIYELTDQGKKVIPDLAKQMKKIKVLYLATDPDREGEAISWHLLEALKAKKALPPKVCRVTFNQITKSAVQNAIKNPREIDQNLVKAQRLRQALDYLVGFNLSPILWKKLPGSRSAGRVQSVALKMLCERENEIDKFKPQEYWEIFAEVKAGNHLIKANLIESNGVKLEKTDIKHKAQAQHIEDLILKQRFKVKEIKRRSIKRKPPLPFITSTLQQAASSSLGFAPKKTMSVAQKLYEGIEIEGGSQGLITYMRTDGVYISKEAIVEIRGLIKDKFGDNYLPKKHVEFKKKIKNAQEAHESIRPTNVSLLPNAIKQYLTEDQFKLYKIIWERSVASQMEDAIINSESITISSEDENFVFFASCSAISFDGFYKAYSYSKEAVRSQEVAAFIKYIEDKNIKDLKIGSVDKEQSFTEPPRRYSEAGLVKKMEELGIGRPSTYATIISVLQDRSYASLQNKAFVPEPRGRVVSAFLTEFFKRYVEYNFTANLEENLDKVADGKIDWMNLINEFWQDFDQNVQEVDKIKINQILESINNTVKEQKIVKSSANIGQECNKCKDGILNLNIGRFGVFLGCSNYPDCKNSFNESGAQGMEDQEFPKNITEDISLNKGPYGIYLKYQNKNFSVPKGIELEKVTKDFAEKIVSLPKVLGQHPEDEKDVKLGMGPYGLYILYNKRYYNLAIEDIDCMDLEKAVAIISQKGSADPSLIKDLGKMESEDVQIKKGRYGPYIKCGKLNVAISKSLSAESITLEDAIELIQKKKQSGPTKKRGIKRKAD